MSAALSCPAALGLRIASISRSTVGTSTVNGFRAVSDHALINRERVGVGNGALRWFSTSPHVTTERAAAAVSYPFRLLLQNYKQLSKAKLSALVVMTAGTGYVLGSGPVIDWQGLGWTSLGTFACAACANTLNQVYERVNDSYMQRTRNRPLPAGRLGVAHALLFAATTGVLGVATLATQTNSTTAALGAGNILLYAGVYTPLKQITIWNTWVGAVVGAVPPLMGWAAATGGLDIGAAVMGATLYFWQMPHFLALAWLCKDDYARGGFRMLSMLETSGKRTAGSALRNCLYLLPVGLAAVALDVTSWPFAAESTALSLGLAYFAASFYRDPSKTAARQLFRASLLYLPLGMACAMAHRVPYTSQQTVPQALPAAVQEHLPAAPELALLGRLVGVLRTGILNLHTGFLAVLTWVQGDVPASSDLRCPSKAYGDSGDSGDSGQESYADSPAEGGDRQAERPGAGGATAGSAGATARD